MKNAPTILIVDDDEGHAILIRENLEAAGLRNPIEHFRDGQEILDFFFARPHSDNKTYLVLLDIQLRDAQYFARSADAVEHAAGESALIVGEIVYAELAVRMPADILEAFLADLYFVPSVAGRGAASRWRGISGLR